MATVEAILADVTVQRAAFLYSVPKLSLMKNLSDEIAFIGRSNSGKSSLINAICQKKDLARTSKTPGRTRHAVVYDVSFLLHDREKPFMLVDLPGFGYAAMAKTEAAVAETLIFSYLKKRVPLNMIVLLLDIRRTMDEREHEIIKIAIERGLKLIIVLTKCDKVAMSKRKPVVKKLAAALGMEPDAIALHSTDDGDFAKDLQRLIFEKL